MEIIIQPTNWLEKNSQMVKSVPKINTCFTQIDLILVKVNEIYASICGKLDMFAGESYSC